jgi:hypothetical protein
MNAPTDPRLLQFFEALRNRNPFSVNRVDAPDAPNSDVREIHASEFRKLTTWARSACVENRGIGVMLGGEAGVGKSHLLSRLWNWTRGEQPAAFVYLHNLQVSPEQLPRYVLQCVVSTLTHNRIRGLYDSDLYCLIRDAIKEALRKAGITKGTQKQIELAYHQLIDDLISRNPAQPHLLDRGTFQVLWHFYLSARFAHERGESENVAAAAVQWLSGKEVDPEETRSLGLRRQPGEEYITLDDNEQIKQVLAVLAQLARYHGMPFILCIDGVDNMGGDRVAALWQFLHGLLDATGNVLAISSGVQDTMLKFLNEHLVQQSSWDRLSQHELPLFRINRDGALRILQERLGKFFEPFPDIQEVAAARADDSLFPLGIDWFNKRINHGIDFRPRDWITWADQRWTEQQERVELLSAAAWFAAWDECGRAAPAPATDITEWIDRKVEEKIADQVAQRRSRPHTLPPNAANLSELVRALLDQCLTAGGRTETAPKANTRTPYQVLCRLPNARVGLSFMATTSAVSATAGLRRLAEDDESPEHVLLITDERQPLPLGKQKNAAGRQLLNRLQDRSEDRFQQIELPFHDYAEMDALQGVIGMAISQDLAVDYPGGRRKLITQEEVIESHRRCLRYGKQSLLARVLGLAQPGRATGSESNVAPTKGGGEPQAKRTEGGLSSPRKEIAEVTPPTDAMLIGHTVADGRAVGIRAAALPTHVAVVGAAGSGKTWVAKVLAEEAILQGIPVLAVDPQGDLVQMCRRRPLDEIPEESRDRYRHYWELVEPRIFTPGSSHGTRVCLSPIRLAGEDELSAIADPQRRLEERETMLGTVAGNLVRLAKARGDIESQQTFVLQVLRKLVELDGRKRIELSEVTASILYPETIRLEDADEFIKKAEREALARKLNSLLHGPAAHLFSGGMALDADALRRPTQPGKVPLNLIYLNALASDEQKQFFHGFPGRRNIPFDDHIKPRQECIAPVLSG